MSSSSVLKIASVTSTKTFGKTDAEVAQIIKWFLADKAGPPPEGLTQAQLNQWYLDQANDEVVDYIRREARRNRVKELREAQGVLEEQAGTETNL